MSSRSSIDGVESEGLLGKRVLRLRTKDNRLWAWLKLYLILSSVFLNVLTAVGVVYLLASGAYRDCTQHTNSYQYGFSTDLGELKVQPDRVDLLIPLNYTQTLPRRPLGLSSMSLAAV